MKTNRFSTGPILWFWGLFCVATTFAQNGALIDSINQADVAMLQGDHGLEIVVMEEWASQEDFTLAGFCEWNPDAESMFINEGERTVRMKASFFTGHILKPFTYGENDKGEREVFLTYKFQKGRRYYLHLGWSEMAGFGNFRFRPWFEDVDDLESNRGLVSRGDSTLLGRQGDWVFYNPSGRPIFKGRFEDGRKVGVFVRYWPEKKLGMGCNSLIGFLIQSEESYDMDLLNGPTTTYYIGGGVEWQGNHVGGRREGVWTRYDESGKKALEITYENGKRKSVKEY